MTSQQIEIIGNLLISYKRDLTYIHTFDRYRHGHISTTEYLSNERGSFYNFLIDYKVARNVEKEQKSKLLEVTLNWIKQPISNNVDDFAKKLCEERLTHDKIMTSLASKILFLNNPTEILPLDNLVKNALNIKSNNYGDYMKELPKFKEKEKESLKICLEKSKEFLTIIEEEFKEHINNLDIIRENRLIDIYLWTRGKSSMKILRGLISN